MFEREGFNVFSEESGLLDQGGDVTVVIDPIDGSTNAARGLPLFTSSVAFLVNGSLEAAVVGDAGGAIYTAKRGAGSYCGGKQLKLSRSADLAGGIVFVNGYPKRHLGWAQMRSLGSASLEICMVAAGVGDGFVDCSSGLAVWDYLGAALILVEAGGSLHVVGADFAHPELSRARRRLVAASSARLMDQLMERASRIEELD